MNPKNRIKHKKGASCVIADPVNRCPPIDTCSPHWREVDKLKRTNLNYERSILMKFCQFIICYHRRSRTRRDRSGPPCVRETNHAPHEGSRAHGAS